MAPTKASISGQVGKNMWNMYTMGYCSAVKRMKYCLSVAKSTELEDS